LPKISNEEFGLIFDELDDTHDVKVIFVLYCSCYLLCTYWYISPHKCVF